MGLCCSGNHVQNPSKDGGGEEEGEEEEEEIIESSCFFCACTACLNVPRTKKDAKRPSTVIASSSTGKFDKKEKIQKWLVFAPAFFENPNVPFAYRHMDSCCRRSIDCKLGERVEGVWIHHLDKRLGRRSVWIPNLPSTNQMQNFG
jgi:hypothetical protein